MLIAVCISGRYNVGSPPDFACCFCGFNLACCGFAHRNILSILDFVNFNFASDQTTQSKFGDIAFVFLSAFIPTRFLYHTLFGSGYVFVIYPLMLFLSNGMGKSVNFVFGWLRI